MATAELTCPKQPGAAEAVALLICWALLDRWTLRWAPVPACLSSAAIYWSIGAARVVETGLLAAYWRARHRGLAEFGLTGPQAVAGLRMGILWSLAAGGMALATEILARVLSGGSVLKAVAGRPSSGQELAALLVIGGVIGPIFEELLFRGVLYRGIRKALGPIPAIVLAALLFASAHQSFRGVQPLQAAGGVLFCAAYEMSGSLWAPLILHVTGNMAIFLVPFLP